MFRFALKNMAVKMAQNILIALSIIVSAGVAVLSYNVANQVSDGITKNASYYSVIIGPSGSKTQLAMNSMYFTEEPVGTIPYSVVSDLMKDGTRVKNVIPFAMADNYNGRNVVGTTTQFLKDKSLSKGTFFDDSATMQAVVGYNVAKQNGLKIGDTIYTSHSASSGSVHEQGIEVVGVLKESYSTFDNTVFTQLRTLWEMHDHGAEAEKEHEDSAHSHGTVCAVLINSTNPASAIQLINEYDGKIIQTEDGDLYTLQAIEPMDIVRDVLSEADDTKYIVFVLCGVFF